MTEARPTGTAETRGHRADASTIFEAHAGFVWASLRRLGVREPDLPDMLQEVFIVVHRRLGSYDGVSKLTTWLFGIVLKVASSYRRKAHRRYERPLEPAATDGLQATGPDPEATLATRQACAQLDAILDELDLEKRAVFVMFEIEQLACGDIADLLGVPVGTVHSRLHSARAHFAEAVARARRREQRKTGGLP